MRANTRENAELTFKQKVEDLFQDVADTNFRLYKRITDDPSFGAFLTERLFDNYLRRHREAEGLIEEGESKTLEFKSTLRWNLREDRKDPKVITHSVLKTLAAFLNTDGGDLLIGVADDGTVCGIDADGFTNHDKFLLHLTQVARNALGDRAGTCIDPRVQIVGGKPVCLVACSRSPEPIRLRWKGTEKNADGDLFVRSGPGTVLLEPDSAREYVRTRFGEEFVGAPEEVAAAEPFIRVEPKPGDRFETCVPLVPLAAAAGAFSDEQVLDVAVLEQAEEWVEPNVRRSLGPGMFVARVRGRSMEPKIPDGAWCLFKAPVEGKRGGRIVLAAHRGVADSEHGGHYTVKQYRSRKARREDGSWRHEVIELRPLNPGFETLVLDPEDDLVVLAEVIEVLR
ncbi:MAG: RNA-binding domain-containing protein [Thermoanaerobaculia bacterium]